jgi:putative DNA methylase
MNQEVKTRKKLIEVALPLEAINAASAREKSLRHGHPSTFHLWWARRPLAAARAVIFAQMVDDPSAVPELFRTEEAQEKERHRLFGIIKELVQWENTTNERVLNVAREEIWKSWHRTCADNKDHPRANELFNPDKLPAFHDPFAGGGSLPLEAQRLGLEVYASDLNPVAVLICKAMIEIPPKFASKPPVNPESRKQGAMAHKHWHGAQGLAEDVRYYGKWMRDEAEKRIGHLYPKIEITADMAKDRPDLKPLVGRKLTVIAWLWARTVKSPNPAFTQIDVPLASTFVLSTKTGSETHIAPVVSGSHYQFVVKVGRREDLSAAMNGTKLARGANFGCVLSGAPIQPSYIYAEANSGRMGARLMAVVAEGDRGRIFLSPTIAIEQSAEVSRPHWVPDLAMPDNPRWFSPPLYGLRTFGDIFSPRQLTALTTFSDILGELAKRVKGDACGAGVLDDGIRLNGNGTGATAYADAVTLQLALAIDKAADYWSTLCFWHNAADQLKIVNTFARQAIPMSWDYAEGNPFSKSSGHFMRFVSLIAEVLDTSISARALGHAKQMDAAEESAFQENDVIVSTDPPYFDNIGYAELSDYFYVWLRHSLKDVFPDLFATMAVPKTQELVATPYRHGTKQKAELFFIEGMTQAMHQLAKHNHPAYPLTIYYAFKQSETASEGTASTGWETFLDAVVRAGFTIGGTWPVRTEYIGNLKKNVSALASSIVLVCRPHAEDACIATRREFVNALKAELPAAISHLQRSNVAPVDLAQAAIGPGMAVYTRYAKILDAEGKALSVRNGLSLINQILDEVLAEQEGDFDADTRWALAWFEQAGFAEGEYGVAETLSKAKVTSVSGLEHAGILKSKAGKVRLLRPEELSAVWDPLTDSRLTLWEAVHHLIRRLEKGGESAAAELVSVLGGMAETARELAYRLYTICERKKRAQEALSYNALVQSWPEITRLARESKKAEPQQAGMFT